MGDRGYLGCGWRRHGWPQCLILNGTVRAQAIEKELASVILIAAGLRPSEEINHAMGMPNDASWRSSQSYAMAWPLPHKLEDLMSHRSLPNGPIHRS